MVASLPTMVDKHIKEQVEKQVHEQDKVQVPERGRLQAEISSQIQQAIDNKMPSLVDASVRNYMSRHILHVHPAQPQTTSIPEQQYQLYLSMKNNPQLQQQDIAIWLALQGLEISVVTSQFPANIFNDVDIEEQTSRRSIHKEGRKPGKTKKFYLQIQRSFKLSRRTGNWP
ncbi:hypothetical protein Tco_0563919 [Tanacetum coccineum]